MQTRMLRTNLQKKSCVLFFVLAAAVLLSSTLFNFPLRLRARSAAAPNSLAPLHPAGIRPDNIVLTPTFDLRTTAAVNWRTTTAVEDGTVQFAKLVNGKPERYQTQAAALKTMTSYELTKDKTVHCHAATLTGLEPNATYRYRVGSVKENTWSEYRTFTTAPERHEPASVVYFGDTQTDPEDFRPMLEKVERRHPKALLYLIAGDIVDRGDLRNQWDDFLEHTDMLFSRKIFAPVMGNHDYGVGGRGQLIFNTYFNQPTSRPVRMDKALNYSFQVGNAYFIVLNRRHPSKEAKWLEKELRRAEERGYDFKIVVYHYPMYNPRQNRSNPGGQKHFVPLFDRYGVDLVLTGHDHNYMRSKKLRNHQPTAPDEPGTVYVVANASTKHYPSDPHPLAETQFANTATYQIISFGRNAGSVPTLEYASYDEYGKVMDAFMLEKK